MLLTPNMYSRPKKKLNKLKGVVIHWYANPKSTAEANRNFFERRKDGKSGYGSAHWLLDDGYEILSVPEDEMAYHVGSNTYTKSALRNLGTYPNNCTIGIELSHPDSTGRPTDTVWRKAVNLAARILKENGLNETNLWTHHQVVGWKDCHRWFTNNGAEWVKFVADVAKVLHGKAVIIQTPKPMPKEEIELVDLLSQGDKGTPVKQLQTDLNKLGYKLEVDGIFGNATDKALEDFQRKQGLPVDGVFGPNTRASLEKAISTKGNTSGSNVKYITLPKTSDSWRVYPTNKAPIKGNEKGFLNPKKFGGLEYEILSNPQTDIYTIKTGDFGKVNIYAAPSTGAKITTKKVATAPKPAEVKKPVTPAKSSGSAIRPYVRVYKYMSPMMTDQKLGTTDIAAIQRALGIKADGKFGHNTELAVRNYQKRHGLTADGIVGRSTWTTLF